MVGEADSGLYRNAIVSAPPRILFAVTLLETQIVLFSRRGAGSIVILHELIGLAGIAIIPFDPPTAEAAFNAFKRYGKGRGHKAQLNIIDCAAYALARTRNLPLLYKGGDFAATDIESALPLRP